MTDYTAHEKGQKRVYLLLFINFQNKKPEYKVVELTLFLLNWIKTNSHTLNGNPVIIVFYIFIEIPSTTTSKHINAIFARKKRTIINDYITKDPMMRVFQNWEAL